MTDTPRDESEPADESTNAADPWQAVRAGLEHFQRPLPHEAIALAHANREAVAPHLVQALEAVAADPTPALDGDYTLHIYAMLLLASWRDTRAWPPLLAIARFDEAVLDGLFGDSLTQSYGPVLASVCPGDTQPLRALIDDESVLIWVRLGSLDAWKLRVLEGDAPAEPFADFLLELGERLAARVQAGEANPDLSILVSDVAGQVCDIGETRLLEPVRRWFDEGSIDEKQIDRAFFERLFAMPAAERVMPHRRYIDDVAAEVSWWAAFSDDPRDDPRHHPRNDFDDDRFDPPPLQEPIVRDGPKIGRNDPCPCGSGKKYKKCHGAN